MPEEVTLTPLDVLGLLEALSKPAPKPTKRLRAAVERANRIVQRSIVWAGRGDWCEGRIDGLIAFWIVREGPAWVLNSLAKTEGSYPSLRQAQDAARV